MFGIPPGLTIFFTHQPHTSYSSPQVILMNFHDTSVNKRLSIKLVSINCMCLKFFAQTIHNRANTQCPFETSPYYFIPCAYFLLIAGSLYATFLCHLTTSIDIWIIYVDSLESSWSTGHLLCVQKRCTHLLDV